MPKVKLFGLVLLITSSLLGFAAITTQTYQIRIRSFGGEPANQNAANATTSSQPQSPPANNVVQFVNIPIVVPLCAAGLLGTMLWFTPAHPKPKAAWGRRRVARRRRK